MNLFVPPRIDKPELLDLGIGSQADARQSLDDLWRINRYLGGIFSLTRHLYPRLRAVNGRVICIDLGAGSGEIAGMVGRWARHQRLDVRVLAVDLAPRHLEARRHLGNSVNVYPIQANGLHLPFAAESIDYVYSSLFLHHFSPESVIQLMRSAFQTARRSIIMSDLVRGWMPMVGFKLVQPFFARSYITRYDAIVSIRRAYTPAEFLCFAREAGIPNARVYEQMPWRMTLVADKS